MNDNANNEFDNALMEQEAAEWLVKRDRGFTPEEQDAFFQWLGEDARRGEYFAGYQHTWQEFDLLAEWLPEHSEKPNPDLLAHGMPRRRWAHWKGLIGAAASIVAIFGIWAVWTHQIQSETPVYQAQHFVAGDYGYHVLEDGTELDMNQGAEVLVEYSENERLVKLLTGEVHFAVAKNPNRPFIVRARGADVRAVGTAFNVALSNNAVEVLVTEGKVRMEHESLREVVEDIADGSVSSGVDLIPGQRSILTFESGEHSIAMDTVESEAMSQLLAWKHETLDFEETPIAEAILEFNRRNEIQVIIADSELEVELEPISATFRSNNLEGFTNLLEITYQGVLEVDRGDEGKIVLRRL